MGGLGRARGFGAPLWWLAPPFEIVRVVLDARSKVPWTGGSRGATAEQRQPWLGRVMREVDRQLAAAHIYVEGAEQ